MNKKAFTLVELLAVILIIGFLASIGVISSRVFFNKAEDSYYTIIENSMLLAGNDYFENHRGELPSGNDYSEISLASLTEGKYIEPVKDSNGNSCTEGMVFVYRKNNKYVYEACLINCGNYTSDGEYCSGPASKIISASGRKVGGGEYDVLKSYNSQSYSDGKDIEVTFNMDSRFGVQKYVVTNSKNSGIKEECNATNNTCSVTITQSGTYKVVAYGEDNIEISSRYINVKIAKGQADFTLNGENKYLISKEDCNNSVTTTQVTINITKEVGVEYETIKYQINDGEYKEPRGLKILENLESGHYDFNVIVSKYSGEEAMQSFSVDVAYLVDYEFDDDHTTGTHEVIKGKTYNYLSSLPATKVAYGQNINVRWHKNDVLMNPSTEVVTDNCTHQLVGKMAVSVNVPPSLTVYCNSLTYDGNNQTLTKTAPNNITFVDNVGKNAGNYTVKAHIDSPQYIWSDGTFADKEFTCSIGKAVATITCSNKNYTGSEQTACSCSGGTIGGTYKAIKAGSYTASCTGDSNHTNPSNESWTMNKVASSITCNSAQNYTGSAITSYSSSSGCGSYTNGSVKNAGTYTVTCKGDSNHNDSTCSFTVNKIANPIKVTTPQTWSTTYYTSAQTHTITAATNAQGTVTYAIQSQPSGSYFSISGTTLTMKAKTPAGSYSVVVRATAAGNGNYKLGYKDITINITVKGEVWFYWGPYNSYDHCSEVAAEGLTNCHRKCKDYFNNINTSAAYYCSTSTTTMKGSGKYCWCHSNIPIGYHQHSGTTENQITDKFATGPSCCTQGASSTKCCPNGGVYYFPYCYNNYHDKPESSCGLESDGPTHYFMNGKCYFERYVARGC